MNRAWIFPNARTVALRQVGDRWEPLASPGDSVDEGDPIVVNEGVVAAVVDEMPPGATGVERRSAMDVLDHDLYHEMHRAYHLAQWHRRSRFCGSCGSPTELAEAETAKVCPRCGDTNYPRISPATIMAIIKDGRLLMARNRRVPRRIKGAFSVLAGFVEPGESLEQCVAREVLEESGVSVKNIRYFGSQPWSFPDSLMVAFTAEWATGEISPDPDELEEAHWFSPGEIPAIIPPRISVSRRLIEWFVSEYGTAGQLREVMERP